MIAEPFEGTPAAKAGLKAGDILMEIDGKDLLGKNNSKSARCCADRRVRALN